MFDKCSFLGFRLDRKPTGIMKRPSRYIDAYNRNRPPYGERTDDAFDFDRRYIVLYIMSFWG